MDTVRSSAKKSLTRFQEKWSAWIKKSRRNEEELGLEEILPDTEREVRPSLPSKLFGSFSPKERFLMIFALGMVLGFGVKTLAQESITIGYRDYSVSKNEVYDLIALQKKVSENGGTANFSGGIQQGGACAAQ